SSDSSAAGYPAPQPTAGPPDGRDALDRRWRPVVILHRGDYPEGAVTPDTAQRSFRVRAVDAANRIGERFLRWLDRYFGRHSLVGDTTFFAPGDFPWGARPEAGS